MNTKEKVLKKEQAAKEKALKKELAAKEKSALKEKAAHEKASYQMVIKGLKGIKEALKKCASKEELDSILKNYSGIDVNKTGVQEYIKRYSRARTKLTALNSRVEVLSKANKQRFSTNLQDSKSDPLSKSITLPKSETNFKAEPPAPLKNEAPKETHDPKEAAIIKPEQLKQPVVEVTLSLTKEDSSKATVTEATKNEITPALNVAPDSAKEQKIVRETQLSEFTKHLKLLAQKRDYFHKEYPKGLNENPNKVYEAMCLLVKSLEDSAESYKNGLTDLKQFKDETTQAVRDKRNGVISNHRGYKEIFYNLLLAIGTLGVGYALAALFTHRLTPIQVNTDSANKLDQAQETINRLTP